MLGLKLNHVSKRGPRGSFYEYGCPLTHLSVDKMVAILADDIFRCIFMNKKFFIFIEISLQFVPKGPIDNNQALV